MRKKIQQEIIEEEKIDFEEKENRDWLMVCCGVLRIFRIRSFL